MKIFRKILKYCVAVSIIFILILYIISLFFEKEISELFVHELNHNLNTTAQTGKLNFSLLRRFPHASIELHNILIKSPDIENKNTGYDYPDTLLYADKMVLTLKITELIQKSYSIDRIEIDQGSINICKGSSGLYNTSIWEKTVDTDTSSISLNINNVNINNSSFSYRDLGTGFLVRGIIDNSINKLIIDDLYTDIKTRSGVLLSGLKTGSQYQLSGSYPLSLSTGIKISKESIIIENSELDIDKMNVEGGCIIELSTRTLSLDLVTQNTPVRTVAEVLPAGVKNFLDRYDITGVVSGPMNIHGKFDKSSPLLLTTSLAIEKGRMKIPTPDIYLDNISTIAVLTLDFNKSNDSFEVLTDMFTAQVGETSISGSFAVKRFVNPYIDIIFTGLFQSEEIAELVNIDGLQSSEGTVRLNARLTGSIPPKSKGYNPNMPALNHTINMGLNSINLTLPGFESEIKDINGNVMIADNIWFDDLSMHLNEQNIALRGMVTGFDKWLAKESDWLHITAGLWSDKLDINMFRDKFNLQKSESGTRKTNIKLNLSLISDSITIGNFRASLFDGNLAYIPGLMDITSFSMNTLDGSLSGNAVISGSSDKCYAVRGDFYIDNIDISKTFDTFNNFRQDYIKSENLEGNITGSINISATADKDLKINRKDLMLNGEYLILNGQLVDFEPAYKLSKFVDMKELERIEFSKLENELIIINEIIIIPKMDISSSAFNISLEGSHAFKGTYEYHLKVLLSELLSKRRNPKVSEFGIIEEDGLGRTSLYMRINGDKNGSKVTHDSYALRQSIREDLIREKQTIKSILQEEYGLYAGDSLPEIRPGENKKFRIVWEETDSIRTEADESVEKKLPLIRLFKKKDTKKEESGKK